MRAALAVLLGAAAAANGLSEGPRSLGPSIAPQFSVLISFGSALRRSRSGPGPWQENATLYYDEVMRTFKIAKESAIPFLGRGGVLHQDNFGVQDRSLELPNGQCYNASTFFDPSIEINGFDGLFGWARGSTHIGHDVVGNRTCDVWRDVPGNRTLCIHGDEPVYIDIPTKFAGIPYIQRVSFEGPIIRQVDPAELFLPPQCDNPPEVCGEDAVEVMQIYLLHPKGQFNISDQDVADARGDVTYMCSDRLWEVEQYKLASLYEISVLQKFGQYLNCNLYDPPYCVGPNRFYVGREAPLSMGIRASQCDDTEGWLERVGTWYSLPAEGRCTEARRELGKDCSWRVERRVKTFELSCLFDEAHGFLQACDTTTPPFDDVVAIYLQAFASEDPRHGGCPSVSPPGADSWRASGALMV